MPTYAYKCQQCNSEYEEYFSTFKSAEIEEPKVRCFQCGSTEKSRMVGSPRLDFRGVGWTSNDPKLLFRNQ